MKRKKIHKNTQKLAKNQQKPDILLNIPENSAGILSMAIRETQYWVQVTEPSLRNINITGLANLVTHQVLVGHEFVWYMPAVAWWINTSRTQIFYIQNSCSTINSNTGFTIDPLGRPHTPTNSDYFNFNVCLFCLILEIEKDIRIRTDIMFGNKDYNWT